jgi:predicted amidophosphoribosyltransferase
MHLFRRMTTRDQTPFRRPPLCASCGRHVRDRDVTLCTRCRARAHEIWESFSETALRADEVLGSRSTERGGAAIRRFFAEACA